MFLLFHSFDKSDFLARLVPVTSLVVTPLFKNVFAQSAVYVAVMNIS